VTFDAPQDNSMFYLRVDDPYPTREFRLVQVVRSDGKVLKQENAWRTYKIIYYNNAPDDIQSYLHIFDFNSTGSYNVIITREYGTTGIQ
jgi:hypothetical protein